MTATPDTATARPRFADTLAVYLKPRVLIVLFLGFSAGLPLALSSSTLLVWMREVGVDLGVIGLFALVGTPYTVKFLWAPVVDALDVPVLSRLLGRRRGWLVLSQLLLIAAIVFLAFCDPAASPFVVAFGALLVATASATQDIVVDAFRVESLEESEQAAGMASYVAAYRIGLLASTAGALFLVSGFEALGFTPTGAWPARSRERGRRRSASISDVPATNMPRSSRASASPRPCSAASPAASSPAPIRWPRACGSAACCRPRRTSPFPGRRWSVTTSPGSPS